LSAWIFVTTLKVNIGNPSPIIVVPPRERSDRADAAPKLLWSSNGGAGGASIHPRGTGLDGSGGAIGSLGWNTGVFEFRIEVKSGDRDIELGVATAEANTGTERFAQRNTWVWGLKAKTLIGDGGDTTTNFTSTPGKGTIISVLVDMDKGHVSFQPGRKHPATLAFRGLKGKTLFPFVRIKQTNVIAKLHLVSASKPPVKLPASASSGHLPPTLQWGRQVLYEPGCQGFYSPCYLEDEEWSEAVADTYRFIGRYVGLALFNNTRIPLKLSRHVIKYMMRKKVQWHDMAFFSTDHYETMRQMISKPAEYIVMGVNDTFAVDLKGLGGNHVYELVPDGEDVEVTAENVAEYVEKAAMAMMVTSVERALDAMRAGFEDVFTPPLAGLPSVLTAEDFTVLLSGSPEIDTAVLRSHCSVSGATPEFTLMFWAYIDSLTPVEKVCEQVLLMSAGSCFARGLGGGARVLKSEHRSVSPSHLFSW
jgi:hypothetical protein